MKKVVIFLGIPGSGKGTQARLLARDYEYAHISTGDLLRALEQNPAVDPSDLQKLADMRAGKLVSDDLIYKLAFTEISAQIALGYGVILDGAIRNVEQAQAYQKFLEQKALQEDMVAIEIAVRDETSIERLTHRKVCESYGHILPYAPDNDTKVMCEECGGRLAVRSDDHIDTIKKRLQEQGNNALRPIADFYRERGLLHVVDGERGIEDVDTDVRKIIEVRE